MNRFVNINYTLRESTLFSSSFGNFLGILLALTVLFIIAYNIVNGVRKSVKSNKEVKISRTKHK